MNAPIARTLITATVAFGAGELADADGRSDAAGRREAEVRVS
jgi:hypothetical protein